MAKQSNENNFIAVRYLTKHLMEGGLSCTQVELLERIINLSKSGKCTLSNEDFAECLHVSISSIDKDIRSLFNYGYIKKRTDISTSGFKFREIYPQYNYIKEQSLKLAFKYKKDLHYDEYNKTYCDLLETQLFFNFETGEIQIYDYDECKPIKTLYVYDLDNEPTITNNKRKNKGKNRITVNCDSNHSKLKNQSQFTERSSTVYCDKIDNNNKEIDNEIDNFQSALDTDVPKTDSSVDDFPSENISTNIMCEGDFYIECSEAPDVCVLEDIEVVHPNDFEEPPEVDYQELEYNSFELDPIIEEKNKPTIKEIDSDWDGLVDSIAETETKIIRFPFDRIYHRVISGISDGIITNENLIYAVNNCLSYGIKKDEIPFIIKKVLDSSSIDNIDKKIQCCINLYEENLLATN